MSDQPIVMAVASYSSKAAADRDLQVVWRAREGRVFRQVAIALVEKGADGQLAINSHDNTAKDLPWGGSLLGGALNVVATPLGIRFLVSATTTTDWAGVGELTSHFWHEIPREQLRRMSGLLEAGQAALVLVTIAPDRSAIGALLAHASATIVTDSFWADLDAAFP